MRGGHGRRRKTRDGAGQHALLAHGMQEDGDKERSFPDRSRVLNACGHQGGEGGVTPHLEVRAYGGQPGAGGRPPNTVARPPSAFLGGGITGVCTDLVLSHAYY